MTDANGGPDRRNPHARHQPDAAQRVQVRAPRSAQPRHDWPKRSALPRRSISNVVHGEVVKLDRLRPATLLGSGGVERLKTLIDDAGDHARRHRLGGDAGAAAQPGKGMGLQGHRPHRPDPGDLRRPRAHRRRQAAGGACGAQLSAQPAGAVMDPSGAPARRLRLPGRPRRKPARNRPPPDRASASPSSRKSWKRSSAPAACTARRASGCRCRSWRWWAIPMPANRRCSTG